MNTLHKLLAIGLIATPLAVLAQTANTPGGQASTGSAIDKSAPNVPATTATSPDMTNPSGSLPPKSGKTMKKPLGKSNTTQPGDASTYPAPAKDGTPTK